MKVWRTRWTRPQPVSGADLPSMRHTSFADFDQVYEPSDDTYLFVDVIRHLAPFLRNEVFGDSRPLVTVEVGSGSGMLSATWQSEMASSYMVSIDINPRAALLTKATMVENHVDSYSEGLQTDLISTLLPDSVDVLLFNPPYVTTPSEEIKGNGIVAAWAGGKRGREVLDRLFPMLGVCMRRKSALLILASEENMPDEIAQILERELGYVCYCLAPRRCMNERLMVILALRE